MFFAAFDPEANDGAEEDEPENDQRGGDETGNRVEGQNIAPVFRFERNVERAEGENRGEQKGEKEGAGGESPALFGAESGSPRAAASWKVMRHNLSGRGWQRRDLRRTSRGNYAMDIFVQRRGWPSQFEIGTSAKASLSNDSQRARASQEWGLYFSCPPVLKGRY